MMKSCVFGGVIAAILFLGMGICRAHELQGNAPLRFVSPDGHALEIDLRAKTISVPGRRLKPLHDCGDEFQSCLTDRHGFSFSFFKKCADSELKDGYKRLRFRPRVVSLLHEHSWLVFDDAPRFMFDYSMTHGLVAIYYNQVPRPSFLSLFRANRLKLGDLTGQKYVRDGLQELAPCTQ